MSSPPGMRTCLGCRRGDDQTALVRVVLHRSQGLQPGDVVLDLERTLDGRGAWLHPSRECLDRALKTRAFARSFRARVSTEILERQWASDGKTVPGRCSHREDHSLAQSTGATASEESE